MLVLNEAFRLDIMPTFEDIKRGAATVSSIEKNIRVNSIKKEEKFYPHFFRIPRDQVVSRI